MVKHKRFLRLYNQTGEEKGMGILIRNGKIVDPGADLNEVSDLYLANGTVQEVGEHLETRTKGDQVIDAEGCLVLPGIVDLHVHFRDPGQTEKEDLQTGSAAAAHGGVTSVVAMPNTTPPIDTPEKYLDVKTRADALGGIHIYQAGALTMGQEGRELSDIPGMARAGIRALSEDGKSVMNARLCKEAFQAAAKYQLLVMDHCEDMDLRNGGCMNEDQVSERLGLPGICNAVEDVIAARDIVLARETGARLHLCHCSTEGVAEMMKILREKNVPEITAEVCPHHLLLTSENIQTDDPDFKMNPPLRTRRDVDALLKGLEEGSFQVISTDHAPHTALSKQGSIRDASFGIVGLETSFALIYTELVLKGILDISQLVEKMCLNPAKILGIKAGTLLPGMPADLMIADISEEYMIDRNTFLSKGKNTPFDGWKVKGKPLFTISDGNIVYRDLSQEGRLA